MKRHRFSFAPIVVALALAGGPAAADEVEEALELALEAYRAGDLAMAQEELDFASQLIKQQKASALGEYLPEALSGWVRQDEGTGGGGGPFGGMMASATYLSEGEGDRKRVGVQIMANSQMVSTMATMFANPAMLGSQGELKRIGRQKVILTKQGELQAVIDNRILVSIDGNAAPGDKEAYFEAIDLRALADF